MRIFFFSIFSFILILGFNRDAHSFVARTPTSDTLTATDSILQFWLSKEGVDDDKPLSKIFYFWVSPEELDSVNEQHALLRSQYNIDCVAISPTVYRQALENPKWNNFLVANYLREGKFGRERSAWPCYWSDLDLFNDSAECKATQLIKVELEDSALIVVFHPGEKVAWRVYDLSGRSISDDELGKRSNQIAAVYFSEYIKGKGKVFDLKGRKGLRHVKKYRLNYYERTFYLCNEKMIKGWHHAVPGMQKKILDDLKYLLLLDAYLGSDGKKTLGPGENGKNVVPCWKGDTKNFSVAQYYFRIQRHASTLGPEAFPFSIDQIIGTLRYRWPKQIHPAERFPSREMR